MDRRTAQFIPRSDLFRNANQSSSVRLAQEFDEEPGSSVQQTTTGYGVSAF
jgi:hypothetical protein